MRAQAQAQAGGPLAGRRLEKGEGEGREELEGRKGGSLAHARGQMGLALHHVNAMLVYLRIGISVFITT